MYDLEKKPNYLLTVDGQPKTAKGEKYGYLTAVMHFAPHKLSGFNVCASATAGCIAGCLNTSGRGGIGLNADGLNAIQAARIQRTRFFKRDPRAFKAMLKKEIDAHIRRAERRGLIPVFRLNGTSDLPWENVRFHGYRNIFAAYPNVQFYDYTKIPVSKRDLTIPNYHLTFSLAESNRQDAIDAINAGVNVAAVVRVKKSAPIPSPHSFGGRYRKVVNGDETDLRFTDAPGTIVGLRAKGRAKTDTSGFVIDVT